MDARATTGNELIERYRAALRTLSASAFVQELNTAAPLPDQDSGGATWQSEETWDRLCWLLAAADEVGERRLKEAVPTIYQLAPLDDPWDLAPGIRHGAEEAFSEDLVGLATALRPLLQSPRAASRRWATLELGLLGDSAATAVVEDLAQHDPEPLVRAEAASALARLGRTEEPSSRQVVIGALANVARNDPARPVRNEALAALASLDPDVADAIRTPLKAPEATGADWIGSISGEDGAQATRRVVRALITGEIKDAALTEHLRREGTQLVMPPGAAVYPPREPAQDEAGRPAAWTARIELWEATGEVRRPTGLEAHIDLRRARRDQVWARLLDIRAPETKRT